MDSETLERIKKQYEPLAPNQVLALVAEVERLQAELETEVNYRDMRIGDFEKEVERLQAKCNHLIDVLDRVDGLSYTHPELSKKEGKNETSN